MRGLAGGVALVTGGASGIGRAVATRLHAEGMQVAVLDVQADRAAEVSRELGDDSISLGVDIRDAVAAEEAVADVVDRLGRIDVLVNAAGISRAKDFLEVSSDEFDLVVSTNLRGTFMLCQLVGRHMVERRSGSIVNIASITGKQGAPHLAAYSATKAGVIALTHAAAASFGSAGVRVNAVCPGMIWTPMFQRSAEWIAATNERYKDTRLSPREIYDEMVAEATLLSRPTEPEEVASAVAFLASEEASGMTGQSLNVDGGMQFH
jgi:meso-butanediol dehydrogenase / (S,S)-butanediol dehydrogenase / diacetyl reductase